MPKTPSISKKARAGGNTISHEDFIKNIVAGYAPKDALVLAGGKDAPSAHVYATKLKQKYAEDIKALALEQMGSETLIGLSRLATESVKVIESALQDPEVKAIDKARLAKDILGSAQAFLPKNNSTQAHPRSEYG